MTASPRDSAPARPPPAPDAGKLLWQLQQAFAHLPALIAESLQQALNQHALACAVCFMAQAQWEARHMAALLATQEKAAAQPEMEPAAFLPADLRPGAEHGPPQRFAATVIIDGTGYCPQHVPGNPAVAAQAAAGGHRPIAVAMGPLSPAMIRAAGGTPGAFTGLPGVPLPVAG